ncbi:hypothetical protein DFH06DRAFT_1485051 [Mycena polygramma]|nr:hypothetical protein DFH06DRAFT_1485051 [Mycena polygramma]
MLKTSPELVLEVLDTLAVPLAFPVDADCLPGQTALLSCSLVCKSWSTHSQRLLFRRVSIDTQWTGWAAPYNTVVLSKNVNKITSFLETITRDTEKSRWLAQNVLSLLLRPHSSTRPSVIVSMLTNLPNLRELDILGISCRFSDAEYTHLRNSGLGIRSLRINADHSGPITSMGPPAWPDVVKLIAALPALRMLDITANNFQIIPTIADTIPQPLGLGLVSFKFSSKWVADTSTFLASLTAGRTDGDHVQLYGHTLSATPADLHGVLTAHGPHLRSLVAPGKLKDTQVLSLCTLLERFECETIPSDELVAAIARTITVLAVTNPTPDPVAAPASYRPPPSEILSVAHLTQQLDTFPKLRAFTWIGSTTHPDFLALQERCGALGIDMRCRGINSLSDDEIQFALRCELLQI